MPDGGTYDPSMDPSTGGYPGMPMYPGGIMPQVAQMAALDPRRALVNSMMNIGQQELAQPTLSPGAMLAKALTLGMAGGTDAWLNSQYQDMNKGAMAAMNAGMSAPDLNSAIAAWSRNPATMGYAMQARQQLLRQQMTEDTQAAKDKVHLIRDGSGNVIGVSPIQGATDTTAAMKGAEADAQNASDLRYKPAQALQTALLTAPVEVQTAIKKAYGTMGPNVIQSMVRDALTPRAVGPTESLANGWGALPASAQQYVLGILKQFQGGGTGTGLPQPPAPGASAPPPGGTPAPAGGPSAGTPAPGAGTGAVQPDMPPPPPEKPPVPQPGAPSATAGGPPVQPPAAGSPPASPAGAPTGVPAAMTPSQESTQEASGKDMGERYGKIIATAQQAPDELQKATLLRDQLHALGMGGPAIPFLGKLAQWAGSLGVPQATLDKYALPNGATEATAEKLSTDLLGEVLKSQFPGRITNTDITAWKNTVPGPGMPTGSADYLFDNVISPKVKRDVDLGKMVAALKIADPSMTHLDQAILEFNDKHPLSSYTPALQPTGPQPTRAQIEAEMRRRGLLK